MLSRARLIISRRRFRWFSSAPFCHPEDEGDWVYSSEWWGTESGGHTVFLSNSDKGNGVVSVVAYPCSRPDPSQWRAAEERLQRKYGRVHSPRGEDAEFQILGYQWRVLRFNDITRQSTAKVMAVCKKSDPGSYFLMQQPHCLAVPYIKSMISAGMAALATRFDLLSSVEGRKPIHILCIGHGGGSLPLFLANKISGAIVHVVEIDPVVISASVGAMGFPASALMGSSSHDPPETEITSRMLWDGIHERLFLYEADAEHFIINSKNIYDLVFVDAYDGEDIFPWKLWDPHNAFLEALRSHLHPHHGTVVVNLHSDSDVFSETEDHVKVPLLHHLLPMGEYVSKVCRAYKDVLLGKREEPGLAFTVSVPSLCNISLVVSNCPASDHGRRRDLLLSALSSRASVVEAALDLPFSCLQYIKSGVVVVD